mgnify:FL=1|jgi:hypothetical protein
MKLEVLRISSQDDSTSGILYEIKDNRRYFLAYTLEDEHRENKVMGETRVPAGTYNLSLRKVGGFHTRYQKKFPTFHIGMLHVDDVPNFEYILLHIGNTDENTAGCLLVGDSQNSNLIQKDGFIGSSTNAYKRIYKPIANAIHQGEKTTITYRDFDMEEIISNKSSDDVMMTSLVDDKFEKIIKDLKQIKSAVLKYKPL